MKNIARLLTMATGLALMLHSTPSWGGPPNPTMSDGNNNTAGGSLALQNVDQTAGGGFSNTAFGLDALENTTTGDNNTAVGALTLVANQTGSFNTAIGQQALASNTTGDNNTAFGYRALRVSTGTKNIGLGYNAGTNLTSGNNNIYIGNAGVSVESQTIRVGTGQTRTFIAGIAAAGVNDATVMIDTTTGQLGVVTSSARYKEDIAPMGAGSESMLRLRPVTFAYKEDPQRVKHYGLIAEDVAAVYPELVTRSATGDVQTIKYQELIPMLLNELQRQQRELAEVAKLRTELAELRALVGARLGQ